MATRPRSVSGVRKSTVVGSSRALAATAKAPINIFVSYSHADSAAQVRLETHLAELKRNGVNTWYDGDLNAGDALDTHIARELRQAHIFVALISPDYLASNYCWNIEYKRAMSRRLRGLVRVVAVVVRPCDWKATRAARFKLLPKDGRPTTSWRPADTAYLNVTEGIRAVVDAVRRELQGKPAAQPKAPPKAGPKPTKAKKAAAKPKVVTSRRSAPRAKASSPAAKRKQGRPTSPRK